MVVDPPPLKQQVHPLAQVDTYMDGFISTCKGGRKERIQIIRHLFRIINTVFRTNKASYGLCEEPISTKKLRQGDAASSTKKTVLG